jgi:hypothetical protein
MEFTVVEMALSAGFFFMIGMAVGRKVEAVAKAAVAKAELDEKALVAKIESYFTAAKPAAAPTPVIVPVKPVVPS